MQRTSGTRPLVGSTSGHCTRLGDVVYATNGTKAIGTVSVNTYVNYDGNIYADAALIAGNFSALPQIYASSTIQRTVVSELAASAMPEGFNMCKTGITTDVTCGNVTDPYPYTLTNVFFTDTSNGNVYCCVTVHQLICAGFTASGGDSGSPVYKPLNNTPGSYTAAAGGLLGYVRSPSGPGTGCYHPITIVGSYTGSRTVLGSVPG